MNFLKKITTSLLINILFLFIPIIVYANVDTSFIFKSSGFAYVNFDFSEYKWAYFINKTKGINDSKSWKLIEENFTKNTDIKLQDILDILSNNTQLSLALYFNESKKNVDYILGINLKPDTSKEHITTLEQNIAKLFDNKKEINFSLIENKFENGKLVKFLILSNNEKLLADIENKSEVLNKYQNIYKNYHTWAYVNMTQLADILKVNKAVDENIYNSLKLYRDLGIGLKLDKNGVYLKSCGTIDTDYNLAKIFNVPTPYINKVVSLTPKDSIFFYSFNQLIPYINYLNTVINNSNDPIVSLMAEMLKEFNNFTGINYKDIVNNSDGNFNIVVNLSDKIIPATTLIIGIKDTNKVANVMKNFKLNLGTEKVNFSNILKYKGTNLNMASKSKSLDDIGIRPGYFIKNNFLVISSDIYGLKKVLDINDYNSIFNNQEFLKLKSNMVRKWNYVSFLDLNKIVSIVSLFLGSDPEFESILSVLNSLNSLGLASYMYKDWSEGDLILSMDFDKIDFNKLGELLEKEFFKELEKEGNN